MKLTTTTFVSVDGVMQGIGAPDEDRNGGFGRGGWITPHFDSETATFLNGVYGRAEAFLLGRRTYEIFAGSWGESPTRAQHHRGGVCTRGPVRGIDHPHRPRWATRPSCPVRSRSPSASSKPSGRRAGRCTAAAPGPVAARQRPRRRDHPLVAPVSSVMARGCSPTRPGRALELSPRGPPPAGDDSVIPPIGAPAVRNGATVDMTHVKS